MEVTARYFLHRVWLKKYIYHVATWFESATFPSLKPLGFYQLVIWGQYDCRTINLFLVPFEVINASYIDQTDSRPNSKLHDPEWTSYVRYGVGSESRIQSPQAWQVGQRLLENTMAILWQYDCADNYRNSFVEIVPYLLLNEYSFSYHPIVINTRLHNCLSFDNFLPISLSNSLF